MASTNCHNENSTTTTSTGLPIEISSPVVTIEVALGRGRDESTGTKVLSMEWDITNADSTFNGEWIVEWDNMYSDHTEDLRSAKSERGSYFALQRGTNTPGAGTPILEAPEQVYQQPLQPAEDYTDGAPLSTAKLLAFENGLEKFEETEDLSAFFASRPIVQAPAQIFPNQETKKAVVYFLITGTATVPDVVRVVFIPTWGAPMVLASVPVPSRSNYSSGGSRTLHTAWAESRIDDLRTLEEIARELEREGARGLGTGRVKVGVEGGGMDEEAVRREGWMVGEEMVWVRETFLNRHIIEEEPGPINDSPSLNLNTEGTKGGLKLSTTTSPGGTVHLTASCKNNLRTSAITQEEEDDLFALPLSPRSPEMAMSPFSMFRGEALGGKPPMSRLNQVVSIDTSLSPSTSVQGGSTDVTPTGVNQITPTMGRLKAGGYAPLTPPMDRVGVGKE